MDRPSSLPTLRALVAAALVTLLVGLVGIPTVGAAPADDAFAINDVTQSEGNAGTTNFTFTVSRAGSLSGTVTVDFATTTGSATAPSDFATTSGTLSFGNGVSSRTITVAVTGDTTDEFNETFFVILTNPSAGTISDTQGQGTINNDDGSPSIGISSPTVTESDTGTVDATFTITLSAASGRTITATATTADGTATAGADYAAKIQDFTFAPGETTKAFVVLVNGDTVDEVDETFSGFLSSATNVSAIGPAGTATILDNDPTPTLSIGDASIVEGDAGTTALTFTVTLSSVSAQNVSFSYATAAGTATASVDYATTSGSTFIAAGTTTRTININVVGDTQVESDETFSVVLSNPVNATVADGTGVGTILNDDSATPSISVNDVTANEGDGPGTTAFTFTISLSRSSSSPVSVDVATALGTADNADLTAVPTTTVVIPAGTTSATVTVQVTGDTTDEFTQTFFLNLTNASGATIADAQGVGTILDDDLAPSIAISPLTVTEGDTGTVNAPFAITLSAISEKTITATAMTANGSATAPADYLATTQDFTFAPGETTKTFVVLVNGDTVDEADETFSGFVSSATNVSAIGPAATATILDNDPAPTLSIGDASILEGDAGTTALTFTVTLSSVAAQNVSFSYGTSPGTATASVDYSTTTGTTFIAAGTTTRTININVVGDTLDEPDETFSVVLSNPVNATIADGAGVGTILNDDDPPTTTTTTTAPTAGGSVPSGQGYSLVGEDGSLYAFGTAKSVGDMKGITLNAPVIAVAYTPGGSGYWLVAKDGGIFTFGDADFYGSMGGTKLNSPVIGMAATPSGKGYWLFAGDGGIFTFGDAVFFGSMGDQKLNAPVINMEPLESGNGYWLVAGDGGIFTFGQAAFYGSMGDRKINQPVFDMTSTDTDNGYWLVARDGGIFSFGDAEPKFFGSAVNESPKPTKVIGMDSTPGALGYWIADASGKVYRYGNAQDLGDRYGAANPAPMIGFASVPGLKP